MTSGPQCDSKLSSVDFYFLNTWNLIKIKWIKSNKIHGLWTVFADWLWSARVRHSTGKVRSVVTWSDAVRRPELPDNLAHCGIRGGARSYRWQRTAAVRVSGACTRSPTALLVSATTRSPDAPRQRHWLAWAQLFFGAQLHWLHFRGVRVEWLRKSDWFCTCRGLFRRLSNAEERVLLHLDTVLYACRACSWHATVHHRLLARIWWNTCFTFKFWCRTES